MPRIPGIKAKHCLITDNCRKMRGDGGAFNHAVNILRVKYDALLEVRGGEAGVEYNLILSVEKRDKEEL